MGDGLWEDCSAAELREHWLGTDENFVLRFGLDKLALHGSSLCEDEKVKHVDKPSPLGGNPTKATDWSCVDGRWKRVPSLPGACGVFVWSR